jgi:hypothetical protein
MLSFNRAMGSALLAVALLVTLAACTGIRPVYSDAALGAKRVNVSYAAPNNRLEQIIYQDLALRLGKSGGDGAPTVTISAWSGNDTLTNNTIPSPTTPRTVTVSASLTVTASDGTVLFSGVRSQTADLTHGWQTLANQQANATAERQAALLLSDTLRLQVLSVLSPK